MTLYGYRFFAEELNKEAFWQNASMVDEYDRLQFQFDVI